MTKDEVFSMLCHLAKLYPESNLRRIYDYNDSTNKILNIAEAWQPFLDKIKKSDAISIITEYRKNNDKIIDLSTIYNEWKKINQS